MKPLESARQPIHEAMNRFFSVHTIVENSHRFCTYRWKVFNQLNVFEQYRGKENTIILPELNQDIKLWFSQSIISKSYYHLLHNITT